MLEAIVLRTIFMEMELNHLLFYFWVCLSVCPERGYTQATECDRERGKHCHKWAQCERRQEDQRPRCYCSPGYGGDGRNCHPDNAGDSGRCSQPSAVSHGSFSASDNSYRVGTVVTFQCQGKYRLQGNSQLTCQQNGQWSASQPRCESDCSGGACQRPQGIDGGSVNVGGNCEVGSRVSYRCDDGLRLVGDTERTCKPNGQWSGSHPRCEKATDCEREYGKHCHRWAQCERRQGDQRPRCYCSPGYDGDGHNCHEKRQDECQKKNHQTCHQHADCLRLNNGKYKCKCRDGYKGDGIYCEGEGCEKPTGITHGQLLATQQLFVRGNIVTYQCNRGYKLTGNAQRTCQDDGRWSGNDPRCEKLPPVERKCQRPQDIQHGSTIASDRTFRAGSTVSYQCIKPYRLEGNSQRTCQKNGQWSGSTPQCKRARRQRRRCQRPQDIPNGNIRTSDETYKPKTVVTYECRHPYKLAGNSQRTCLGRGKWTGTTPKCEEPKNEEEKKCRRPLEHFPQGRVTISDYQFNPGTIVTYACERGWRLQGISQRTCQIGGRWSGNRPRCQRAKVKPKDKCQNRCHANADCKADKIRGRCECRQPYFGDGYHCRTCDWGQVYRNCATRCPPTCDTPNPICDKSCDHNVKCVCPEGKVQRSGSDKTCIDWNECI